MLRELPEDVLIFITSDHGFTPVPRPTVTVPDRIVADRYDVKYRRALTTDRLEGKDSKRVIEFDARVMGILPFSETLTSTPIHHVLFPCPGFTLRWQKGHRPPDRYTHGGLSLAECMVPMVVMGPRREEGPALRIESVRQVGSVSEGEELEIEISVVPRQIPLPDMATTRDVAVMLTFSRGEIPTRRNDHPLTLSWLLLIGKPGFSGG